MRCEELMKRHVECLTPSDSVQAAALKMRDADVGFLPVCDQSMNVLGALTDRDIAIRLAATDRKASSTQVEEIMTPELVSCGPQEDIRTAEELMAQNQKARIMVCDPSGRLIGVISLSDIAQCEGAERTSETLRRITGREATV